MNARLRFFQRITVLRQCMLLVALLSLSLTTQAQTIHYVKPIASGNGSGSSWTNASSNLQAMIDASARGDQVWVAAGIYKPGGNANTNRTISFVMKNGVAIYGGFAGSETLLTQRPVINPTTGQPSSTTLSGEIGSASTTDNSYHVVNNDQTGIDNTAVLDGFVITGGNANGESGNARAGGGMINVLTSPTVRNCSFQANTATNSGGGMYNGDANPRLTNCSFQANTAVVGGGMCTSGGNPILTNCGFQANTGTDSGGGMYNSGANVRLTNCNFQANTAGIGGGIDNEGSSSSTLLNCSFQSNTANNGGGLFINPSSTANLINCSFQGNSASDGGGAVYAENSCPLTNCVLFGNGGANTLATAGSGTVTLRYSLIEASETGYTNGGNNLTATVSPFVSTTSTQLNGCTPAIDAGNLSAYTTAGGPTTDLAGNPRPYNSGPIDMGAYEFQAASALITLTNPTIRSGEVNVFFSQNFSASGGTSPRSFSVASGSLPSGLTLSAAGVLSGTPTQSGSFTITVQVTDANGCSTTGGAYVLTIVDNTPVIENFAAVNPTVCAGSPVTFTATVSNVSGIYNFTLANGITTPFTGTRAGGSFSQSLTPSGTGTQSFTLIVSDNSQSSRVATEVTVNPLPVASLGSSGPLSCSNASVTLTAAGGTSYTFTRGGVVVGTPGSLSTLEVTESGTYSVRVANASGCVNTTTTTVTSTTAIVTLTNPTTRSGTVNVFFSQTFSASGGATPRSFSVASGSLPTGLTLSAAGVLSGTPTQSGSFTITVRATDANGCSATGSAYVLTIVDNRPTIENLAAVNPTVCVGSLVTFTAAVGNVSGSYNFTLTNGINTPTTGVKVASSFSQNVLASGSGTQSFSLIITGNGLSARATTEVTVSSLPVAGLSNSGPLSCTNSSVTLTATGGSSYTFTNNNGEVLTGTGNTRTVLVAGTYQVRVANASGCVSTTGTTVTSTTATVSLTNPTTRNGSVNVLFSQTFSASGGTSPRSFSVASGSLPGGLTLSAAGVLSGTPTQDGSFTITVQVTDANGCSATGSAYVLTIVDNSPTINGFTTLDNTVCMGSPITFAATVGNVTGSYNFTVSNGTSTTTGTSSNANFSQNLTASGSGNQTFTLTINDNSQLASATTSVTVNALPIATLTPNFGGTLTCGQTSLTLTSSGGTHYEFARQGGGGFLGMSGAIPDGVLRDGFAIVNASGVYSVTVNNSNTGCRSTTTTTVYSNTAVITVSNPATATGTLNTAFNQTFTASGGVAPRSFSLASGSLPTGLSLNTATGVLLGTPTQSGNFPITVRATDANGCSGVSTTYALVINNTTPTLTGFAVSPSSVCAGSPLSFTASVGNFTGSYTYTLTNGSSPLTGTASSPTFSQLLTASGAGPQAFTLTVSSSSQLARATTSVTVTQPATASITYPGTLYCTTSSEAPSPTLTGTLGGTYSSSPAGLSINSTTGQVVANTSQPGSYTVSYTLSPQGSCPAVVATAMLTIASPPTLGSIQLTQPTCAVPTGTISVSAVGQGSIEYSKDGIIWQLSGVFSGLLPGNYTIQARAQSAAACIRTTSNFTIDPVPTRTASISYAAGPYCQSASTTYAPTRSGFSGGSFSSSPVGLSINSGGTVFPIFSQPGSYTVSYTLPAQESCPAVVATASLTIIAAPTFVFGGGFPGTTQPTCVSPTGTISLSATGSGAVEYSRDNGANWQASGTFANLPPNQLYTILARSVANPGCSRSLSLSINAVPSPPVASILTPASSTLTCTMPSLSLTATGGGTYRWNDNTSSATKTVNTSGVYSVTVTSPGGCTASASVTIDDNQTAPQVSISASSTLLTCTNPSATLTAAGTGSFHWSTGSTESQISVSASGIYTVVLTSPNGCTASASVTIGANQTAPQVSISASSTILTCTSLTATLTATGSGSVRWNTGSTDSQIIVSTAGLYSVTLTSPSGCTASTSVTIGANQTAPQVSITASNTVLTCSNSTATLTAAGTGSFRWSTGSTESQISVSASGIYSVTLTSPVGCTASTSVSIGADQTAPQVSITTSSTVLTCNNPTATLMANGTGTVRWSTGSDQSQISVITSGTYSVTLTSPNGCTASASVTIGADQAAPQVSITSSSTVLTCASPTATLIAIGTGSIRWSTGSTQSQISVSASGIYSVTLTSPGGCSATASVTINADQTAPQVSITTSSTVLTCNNPTATLMANGTGTVRWSTGSDQSQISVITSGTYSVTLTSPNGCTASASVTIGADQAAPQVSITASSTVLTCSNSTATLTAIGTGSVRWSTGSTDNQVSVSTAGIYSVTLTSPGGCMASTSVTINVNQTAPQVSISASSTVLTCASPSATLTANGTGTVRWSTGSTENQISVSASGTYSVTLTSPSGCTATASVTVDANQTSPQVSITASSTVLTCANPTATLTAVGMGTVRWSTGSTQNQISVSTSGAYSVTLTSTGGCTASTSVTIGANQTAPQVSITASSTILTCANPTATLTANGAGSVRWSTGSTQNQISVIAAGTYSVTLTSDNGCTASNSVTINANQIDPQVSIGASSTVLTCNNPTVTLTANGSGSVRWNTGSTDNQIIVSASGTYSVTLTSPGGCTASANVTVGTDQMSPQVSIMASSTVLTCASLTAMLTANGTGLARWNTGSTESQITVSSAGLYSVILTAANGCTATAAVNVEGNTTLGAPTLLTQSGQSNITVELNSAPVTLLASGCAGTINWTGSNNTAGTGTPILVPTTQPGTLIYQAVCQQGSCTSPPASVTVNVAARPASGLMVLHRDVDNYANNNAVQPMIQLLNTSTGSLTLSAITLRYYLTVEGTAALSNLSINYAQVGNQNVRLRYVPLNPAQQGASGYVEYSFTPESGNLAAGANSGNIQSYFAKGDYSGFNELDDYSYALVRDQLVGNPRITAYYNGALVWGIEPGNPAQIRALRALTESKNGPSATQISTYMTIRNEGSVPVNYSDLRARYYFTSDGNERLQVEVDEGNVSTQLVALSPAVGGANYYLEIRYNQGGQLAPGASAGQVRYRISKPNGGRFDQTNDYSYQEQPAESSSNGRVTVYVGTDRVWGTEPSGTARLAAPEPMPQLEVTVIGNPVRGDVVSVAIKGAESQPLHIQLVTAQGGILTSRQVASAQSLEQQQISIAGQSAGVYLLQVSTPTQSRSIRVLKVD